MRVRMMYLAPHYDFGELSIGDYEKILLALFLNVLLMSQTNMIANHIKFHLRSPADRQFFNGFRDSLDAAGVFKEITVRGSWLYITKS